MDLATEKMIPKSRLLAAMAPQGVSKECGTKAIKKLTAENKISPLVTPTDRELFSFQDAQIVVAELVPTWNQAA